MNCTINSMYICVRDMDRAINFYENFFEMNVSERDEVYSVFNIDGFRFGLFAYEKVDENHTFGSNCIPSFDFSSIEILKSKIKNNNIVFPLTKLGKNYVAEIEDSEGNHIEITTPVKADRSISVNNKDMNDLLNNILKSNETEQHVQQRQITIQTDRLRLRPLSLKELININIKNYDELKTKIEKESLISSTRNAIAKKIVKMENINKNLHVWYTYWLMINKDTGRGIGFVGFKGIPDEKGYVEVGYSISPLYRNKGLMTESLRAMIKWAGSEKICRGIIAYALKSNVASNKVLTNCGFKESSFDEYIKLYKLQINNK